MYFNIFQQKLDDIGWQQGTYQKQKLFREGFGLQSQCISTPEPPEKMFLSENVIFRGLKLSLGHFGQEVPESPVSQLQYAFADCWLFVVLCWC